MVSETVREWISEIKETQLSLMNGKNVTPQCTSRYCPINSVTDEATVIPNGKGMGKKFITPKNDEPRTRDTIVVKPLIDPQRRQAQADETLINRNRELRQQMDDQRALQQDREYRATIVTGAAEAAKMRILLMLGKFQTLQVEYCLLSEYFDNCLKKTDQSSYDISVIRESLVFDRDDLKNSAMCYTAAIANVKKLKLVNFNAISDIVDGLSAVLKDLQ